MYNKVLLIVIEGLGIADDNFSNMLSQSDTKCLDSLKDSALYTSLKQGSIQGVASPYYGYYNIGACEDILSDKDVVDRYIEEGDFFSNERLHKLYMKLKFQNKALHLVGMVSGSDSESSIRHLKAFLELAKRKDLENVYIHIILDGIGGMPKEAITNISEIRDAISEKGVGKIASIIGRSYVLTNGSDYEKLEEAYNMMVYAEGKKARDIESEIVEEYLQDRCDNDIRPIVVEDEEGLTHSIQDGDGIIFFGHRGDIQEKLITCFSDPYFDKFKTEDYTNIIYTLFDFCISKNISHILERKEIPYTLMDYLKEKDVSVCNIYDSNRKYCFEKSFLNYSIKEYDNVKSIVPNVAKEDDYMKNYKNYIQNITNFIISEMKKENDLLIADYSMLDIISERYSLDDIVFAIEEIDRNISEIVSKAEENGVTVIITSTHGKVEEMIDKKSGEITKGNTKNDVPLYVVTSRYESLDMGSIANIGPTVLDALGLVTNKFSKKSLLGGK